MHQKRRNSSLLAMELRLFCIKSSLYTQHRHLYETLYTNESSIVILQPALVKPWLIEIVWILYMYIETNTYIAYTSPSELCEGDWGIAKYFKVWIHRYGGFQFNLK